MSIEHGDVNQEPNFLRDGAAFGAAAYVLNYGLIYLFVTIDGAKSLSTETWRFIGILLYNAQFVDTRIRWGTTTGRANMLTDPGFAPDLGSAVPMAVYHLAPILVLVGAGFILMRRVESRRSTAIAAGVGATLVVGYLVPSVAGVFLFEELGTRPVLASAVVTTGILYPVLWGGVGAAIENEV